MTVQFKETQPENGLRLNEVPSELYGKWNRALDDVLINKEGLTIIEIKKDSLGNTIDTLYDRYVLSESFRLYKAEEIYVLHVRYEKDPWALFVMRFQKNGDINIYNFNNPDGFSKDKNLIIEEAVFNVEGNDTIVKTLKPNFKAASELKKVIFSGQMDIATLRKALKKNQLFLILKKDGTFYVPETKNK